MKMKVKSRINVASSNFISRYNEIRHTTERVCKAIEWFDLFPSVALDASRIQARTLLYYQFLQLYFNSPQNLAKKGDLSRGGEIFKEINKTRKVIEKFPKEIFRYFWPNIYQNEYFIDEKLLHTFLPTFYSRAFSLSFLWCFLWGRRFRLYLEAPAGVRIDCDRNLTIWFEWQDWMKKIKKFFRVKENSNEVIIQNFFKGQE